MSVFLAILRRHPVARAAAAWLFLFGFSGAATSPYLPIIAIRELGMTNAAYSAVIFAAAVANVGASIGIGLLADRRGRYRPPLLATSALGVAGFLVVWLLPSAAVLAVAMILPIAAWNATTSLVFAKVKSHADEFTPAESEDVGALLRMMISLAWVLLPGAVGLALAGRPSLLPGFLVAAVVAAAAFAVVAFGMPPDRPATGTASAGLTGLGALADPGLLLRVAGIALASSVLHVNAAVLPLIVTGRAGGTAADVGVILGYVALLEVVFIFVWARVARRLTMPTTLVLSLALYLVYLVGIGTAHGMLQVHAASVVGGIAAAALITLPIPYLLDLIAGRPGLSASLMAVNQFLGAGVGAAVFAIGAALGGYPAAAALAGAVGLAGAGLVLALDGRHRTAMLAP